MKFKIVYTDDFWAMYRFTFANTGWQYNMYTKGFPMLDFQQTISLETEYWNLNCELYTKASWNPLISKKGSILLEKHLKQSSQFKECVFNDLISYKQLTKLQSTYEFQDKNKTSMSYYIFVHIFVNFFPVKCDVLDIFKCIPFRA